MAETRTLEQLVGSVHKRRKRHRGGIALASDYVSTIGRCLGEAGAEKFFGMGSERQWAEALKDAERKLVYRDPAMVVSETHKKSKKSNKDESGLVAGACMEFDCVLTSRRKDRDSDVLEPGGATLDPSMPLLWQHIPLQPIGKMVKVLEKSEDVVKIKCAIVDNDLGRDAAKLVEFGALRISHGFVPTKYKPLEEEGSDKDEWLGWHVLEYDVLEVSLVSIPSNTDAAIEAFSSGKLHNPLVKEWAQRAFRKRPVKVYVGGKEMAEKKTNGAPPVNVHVHLGDDAIKKAKGKTKDDDNENDENDDDEDGKDLEASELASLGRVSLILEQLSKMELDDNVAQMIGQALTELHAVINSEGGEADDDADEADTEPDDQDERADEADDDADEEAEDEKTDDDVVPKDSVGRADEDDDDNNEDDDEDGKDYVSSLFAKALAEERAAKEKGTKTPQSKSKPVKKPEDKKSNNKAKAK